MPGRGNFATIRPSIYVQKEQRKHEFENRLKEQAAGGYNQMRRRHQKSLRQVICCQFSYLHASVSTVAWVSFNCHQGLN